MSKRDPGTEPGARRAPVWLTLLLTLVVLAALVGAVVVVVNNARRAKLGTAPVYFKTTPRDSALSSTYQGMRRRVRQTERRIARRRDRVRIPTPSQDSLARRSDSAVSALQRRLVRFDSLSKYESRRALMDSVKQEYDDLRLLVRLFGRSVGSPEDSIDVDSLDAEMKRLISE